MEVITAKLDVIVRNCHNGRDSSIGHAQDLVTRSQ